MDELLANRRRWEAAFPTDAHCDRFLVRRRWPGGPECPRCQFRDPWRTVRGRFCCRRCRWQTSVTAGTAMHRSHVPLRRWFWTAGLLCSSRTPISAKSLQRVLGIGCYRTAWLMLHKMRYALRSQDEDRLSGEVVIEAVRPAPLEQLLLIGIEPQSSEFLRFRIQHIRVLNRSSVNEFVQDHVQTGPNCRITMGTGTGSSRAVSRPVRTIADQFAKNLSTGFEERVHPKYLQLYANEFAFLHNYPSERDDVEVFTDLIDRLLRGKVRTWSRLKRTPDGRTAARR